MITVNFMKPFYTKVSGNKLRLVFAYQYFAIEKDDEVYHFIPIEGKEIVVNLESMQVENMSEVFVFQRGNKFIRLPIYQLLLVSDVTNYLTQFTEGAIASDHSLSRRDMALEEEVVAEVDDLISKLEKNNLQYYIDQALDAGDKELFHRLCDNLS